MYVLTKFEHIIAHPLEHNINESFKQGIFPQYLKQPLLNLYLKKVLKITVRYLSLPLSQKYLKPRSVIELKIISRVTNVISRSQHGIRVSSWKINSNRTIRFSSGHYKWAR